MFRSSHIRQRILKNSFDCTNHHLCLHSFQWRCSDRSRGRLGWRFLKSARILFEFVLRRGGKRVCIVEAKKDDMSQGMAQNLLGCEVAAEIGHLESVYGIITNYVQWN